MHLPWCFTEVPQSPQAPPRLPWGCRIAPWVLDGAHPPRRCPRPKKSMTGGHGKTHSQQGYTMVNSMVYHGIPHAIFIHVYPFLPQNLEKWSGKWLTWYSKTGERNVAKQQNWCWSSSNPQWRQWDQWFGQSKKKWFLKLLHLGTKLFEDRCWNQGVLYVLWIIMTSLMEQDENHVHHFCDLLESYLQSSERTNLQTEWS